MGRLNGLLGLLLAVPVWGADPGAKGPLSASGYLKNLWQYSHSAFDQRPYFLNTTRARLTLEGTASAFKTHIDYDHEALAGSYFRSAEYRIFGLGEAPTWLDLDQTISTGDTVLWRHRLYRGWAGLETDQGILRFGRQRIAWGTGKFWNPTDVLNAYQPTIVEREERRGVDALYGRYALGTLSQAELAYAPQERWPQSSLLGRLKTNWKDYDFSLMGGKVASSTSSWMLGGDLAGNLWDGTLHGEWSYADPKTRTPYWKADLGYDYTFSADAKGPGLKDAAVSLEYFHSGAGALDRARYNFALLFSGREVTLAQDYMGFSYSKDIHPLVKLELFMIANLNDESTFFGPSLQWNALADLYLTAGFQRFGGGRASEFGRAPNLGYLQGQFYF